MQCFFQEFRVNILITRVELGRTRFSHFHGSGKCFWGGSFLKRSFLARHVKLFPFDYVWLAKKRYLAKLLYADDVNVKRPQGNI